MSRVEVLERELAEEKATQARAEKAERHKKWQAAVQVCFAQRAKCNSLAGEIRAALIEQDRAHRHAAAAWAVVLEFQNSLPADEVDFRPPQQIEDERARLGKLREEYEVAASESRITNASYGGKFAEWLRATQDFETACFLEGQLRPAAPQKRTGEGQLSGVR